MVLALVLPYCSWFWQLLLVLPLKFRRKENCHCYCHCCWPKKYIAIGIAIDIGRINTLALLLPLTLIWRKHCHCYCHWYWYGKNIAIAIDIDIVTWKKLLLILPLILWQEKYCYWYCHWYCWFLNHCYCHWKFEGLTIAIAIALKILPLLMSATFIVCQSHHHVFNRGAHTTTFLLKVSLIVAFYKE